MEAKLKMPEIKLVKPAITLAPQPKAALAAAMPAQTPQQKPSTAPVHLGDTFGVTPNPNATKPATVAAIGNPYGGMQGPSVAPHGVVGSTGLGNGTKSGSNSRRLRARRIGRDAWSYWNNAGIRAARSAPREFRKCKRLRRPQ